MIERIDPIALTPRFAEALTYAERVHAGQTRKGTSIPYIAHPLGVASIALEHGANEDEAIAALLHDAIEDSPDPRLVKEELRRRRGRDRGRLLGFGNAAEAPLAGAEGAICGAPSRGISLDLPGVGFGQALQRPGHPRGLPGNWRSPVGALHRQEG